MPGGDNSAGRCFCWLRGCKEWLEGNELLFLNRDRSMPIVVIDWSLLRLDGVHLRGKRAAYPLALHLERCLP